MSRVRLPTGQTVHADRLIVSTARSMAHEVYDVVMRKNEVFARWKKICPELTPMLSEALFVDYLYPYLIEDARATLAGTLVTLRDEALRETISEAIIRDTPLREGRRRARAKASTRPTIVTRDGIIR